MLEPCLLEVFAPMKLTHALLLSIPLAALAVTDARDAAACGGCFVPPLDNTQVSGHRMLLSISQDETTLWDQIVYSGNPSEFAWVLPTKGTVEVGLSSDALFAFLEDRTRVTVAAPPLNCPPPPGCWGAEDGGFGSSGSASGAGGAGGGVTVVAEEVVGPYETVQLSSQDPAALKNWLLQHKYNIPADIAPVVDAYVKEGFNFLALKLVPGQGIESMRPVRVTSQGATPVLPLRMVAAGTGAITPITLWVAAEGRYNTTNFPWFTVDPTAIVWNWDKQDSNYADLKQAGFDANQGKGWLVEYARPTSPFDISDALMQVASSMPELSGYGDAMGMGALAEAQADMDKLFGKLNQSQVWVSRMHGELSRKSLAADLQLGAAMPQDEVSNFIQATKTTGTTPACQVWPPCPESGSGGFGAGGSGTGGLWGGFGSGNKGSSSSGGCTVSGNADAPTALVMMGLGLGLSLVRRRRRTYR
jgi:MYXO-CTERM domain-containing protein